MLYCVNIIYQYTLHVCVCVLSLLLIVCAFCHCWWLCSAMRATVLSPYASVNTNPTCSLCSTFSNYIQQHNWQRKELLIRFACWCSLSQSSHDFDGSQNHMLLLVFDRIVGWAPQHLPQHPEVLNMMLIAFGYACKHSDRCQLTKAPKSPVSFELWGSLMLPRNVFPKDISIYYIYIYVTISICQHSSCCCHFHTCHH